MNSNNWANNPDLNNIDPMKLQMLNNLANEGSKKNMNEMLPFLLSAMSQTNNNGMSFSGSEKDLLLNVLMQNLSPQEKQKAENIVKMASTFKK